MPVLAVGSPKGGVGKSSTAVTLAAIASRDLSLSVLVVDADENRSALDWITRAGDLIPVDVAPGTPHEVRKLRRASRWDLVIVDLPGAREGAFAAVLGGDGEGPVCDYLLVPSGPEVMDLRPVVRVIRTEVVPLGLPYSLVFTRVPTESLPRARERQAQLRVGSGLSVATTCVRSYTAFNEAVEGPGPCSTSPADITTPVVVRPITGPWLRKFCTQWDSIPRRSGVIQHGSPDQPHRGT